MLTCLLYARWRARCLAEWGLKGSMGDSTDEEVGKDVRAVYVEVDGEKVRGLIKEERSTFLDDKVCQKTIGWKSRRTVRLSKVTRAERHGVYMTINRENV